MASNDARADRELRILKAMHQHLVTTLGAHCLVRSTGLRRAYAGGSRLEGVWRGTQFRVSLDLAAPEACNIVAWSGGTADADEEREVRDAVVASLRKATEPMRRRENL
jgi:hypothetical protein